MVLGSRQWLLWKSVRGRQTDKQQGTTGHCPEAAAFQSNIFYIEVMTQQGTQSLSVISQEKNKSEKAREEVSYPGGREQIHNTNIC